MIENAVYVDGNVAVRYYMPTPKYIQIGTKEYVCTVQHGVSLVFVPEAEVSALLATLGGCCGRSIHIFSLCHQEAYNIFSTGNR